MSFVIYDVETTGLTRRFDQIVQFAALRTDAELRVQDQFDIRCRLMPHVLPSPEAMLVTGLRIDQLLDGSLPSHYEMVATLRRTLESWSPAIFLGFNSLAFDEEFLRRAFYLCLYNPYLTNTLGNARADVLYLCRMTAHLRPDVIQPGATNDGCETFKLTPLAQANRIAVPTPGNASADVEALLGLCRIVKEQAPDIWSQFVRFSKKTTVDSFIADEEAFVFSETVGNRHWTRVVTPIGTHTEQRARHYCLPLNADIDALRTMSDRRLFDLSRSPDRPTITIRSNAAPTLWPLYEAANQQLAPFSDEAEILERVARIREDTALLGRLRHAAQSAEPDYPPSPYLEDQIYSQPFPSRQDAELMEEFHALPWEARSSLARRFDEPTYRRLALRLIYFERPDLLSLTHRTALQAAVHRRLAAAPETNSPWRSIPTAQRDLKALLTSGNHQDHATVLAQYLDHLNAQTLSS